MAKRKEKEVRSEARSELMLVFSPEGVVYNSQEVAIARSDGSIVSNVTLADMVTAYNQTFGAGYTREQVQRGEFKSGVHAEGSYGAQIMNGNGNGNFVSK